MPLGCRRGWRAAERLVGELRERMAVMDRAHREELAARDVVIAGQADRIAQLERRLGRDSPSSSSARRRNAGGAGGT